MIDLYNTSINDTDRTTYKRRITNTLLPFDKRTVRFDDSINSIYLGPSLKKVKNVSCTFSSRMGQIQKLAVEVFEFVPLLDDNVQAKFFAFFEEGPTSAELIMSVNIVSNQDLPFDKYLFSAITQQINLKFNTNIFINNKPTTLIPWQLFGRAVLLCGRR